MAQIMIAPSKYMQGPGAIREVGPHVAALGMNAVILGSKSGYAVVKEDLNKALADAGVKVHFEQFQGEVSRKEIDRVNAVVKAQGGTVVLAVGGGKCIDTGKAVAHENKIPVVVIPTIASTDAPCSALTVTYTEDHVFESYYVLPQNPNLVVVDSELIAKAPARFLVAGMGDGLATWFEADACRKSRAKNMPGGDSTEAALALAHLCFDLLMRFGRQAKAAAEVHAATPAMNAIMEANTLLSGLGFESSGLAGAHAVHDGFTALPECHHLFHGEKVAFGTLTQLVLENRELDEIEEVLDFCTDVGLPVTLAEMGVKSTGKALDDKVMLVANNVSGIINNEPCSTCVADIAAAIKGADALGRAYLARTGKKPATFEAMH